MTLTFPNTPFQEKENDGTFQNWIEIIFFLAWGSSGLAVGLAAKEVVGNMFGGASLFISRPFVIGEKIKVRSFRVRVAWKWELIPEDGCFYFCIPVMDLRNREADGGMLGTLLECP